MRDLAFDVRSAPRLSVALEEAMGTEQRKHSRAHVLRRARVVFANGHTSIDCVVLDVSAQGARLRMGYYPGLPDTFELRMERGPIYQARVRFRRLGEIGIEFVEPHNA